MSIRVGNAPVSWAVYEADRPNPPFARVLDQIAEAGYEGTELGPYGYLPTSAEALAAELSKRHLALGSSFVPLPLGPAKTLLKLQPVRSLLGVPPQALDYFDHACQYDCSVASRDLQAFGIACPRFPEYAPRLITFYLNKKGQIRREAMI